MPCGGSRGGENDHKSGFLPKTTKKIKLQVSNLYCFLNFGLKQLIMGLLDAH